MENLEKENLRKLLAGLMDKAAAGQMLDDIEKGDEILAGFRAPEPNEQVLAEIKKNVAAALRQKRINAFKKQILVTAAAAAMILVSVLAIVRYSNQPGIPTRMIAASVWEGGDDADVTVLRDEIENIQSELWGGQFDDSGNTNIRVDDLENELIEINGDMWKG